MVLKELEPEAKKISKAMGYIIIHQEEQVKPVIVLGTASITQADIDAEKDDTKKKQLKHDRQSEEEAHRMTMINESAERKKEIKIEENPQEETVWTHRPKNG